MRPALLTLLGVIAVASNASAQAPPIRDNSLLVEEAYNQEPGVVQHVLLFSRDRATRDWELGFTQEWPLASQDHQLSYSLPLVRAGGESGLGDVAVSYRYRWLARPRSESVIRVSALLPTGAAEHGRGAGAPGIELNLPVSVEINPRVAAHWNVGGSIVPRSRAPNGIRRTVREAFAGASAIWLASPTFNLLAEAMWSRAEALSDEGVRSAGHSVLLVPGIRGAINYRSGAQIVPGAGLMVETVGGARIAGLLLYLSFEHAFRSGAPSSQ